MPRIRTLACLLFVILLSSCIREEFDPGKFRLSGSLEPGLAVPVGFSKLEVEKFLRDASEDSILRISDDGFLSLRYSSNVLSGTIGELFSIPPVNLQTSILNQTDLIIDIPVPGTNLELEDSILIPFTLAETSARLDSIQLQSGNLQVDIDAPGINGNITLEFPGLQNNGIPFSAAINLPDNGFSLSLAGYTIIAEHDTVNTNMLRCMLTVNLESPVGPILPGESVLGISTGLDNLVYETIFGDFSELEIDIPSIKYAPGVFSQVAEGQFEFAAPKISLFFTNSVGAAGGIAFRQIEAIDRNNIHHSLSGPGVPTPADPKIIAYPGVNLLGEAVNDSIIIDATNSNLPVILGSNPDTIIISASASLDPPEDGNPAFLHYDSRYSVDAALEIPIWAKAEFFVLLDTLGFDYLSTSLPVPEELERLIVRINITNSFPVSVTPQVYLFDENFVLLDSLFSGTEGIEGGDDTNGDGKVDPHIQDPFEIDLSKSTIVNLSNTHSIVTRGKLITTGYPEKDVRFYVDYFLYYNIGLIAQLKINTGK